MSRSPGEYTEEQLALLTPAERAGLTDAGADAHFTEAQKHIRWCQLRALAYLDDERLDERTACREAVASMTSDLGKHPDTAGRGRAMAMIGMMEAASGNTAAVERWIEGF